ncbi:ABC transporter permease, partial [Streptomyces sp. NRRL F-4711]
WGFVAPAVVFMLLFFGYPLVGNVVMSFQDYTPKTFFRCASRLRGAYNWSQGFQDARYGKPLWDTLGCTASPVLSQFCIGLPLRVFLTPPFPPKGGVPSLLFLP